MYYLPPSLRTQHAFTLVELLIVIVIIGILIIISYPAYTQYQREANYAEASNALNRVLLAKEVFVSGGQERFYKGIIPTTCNGTEIYTTPLYNIKVTALCAGGKIEKVKAEAVPKKSDAVCGTFTLTEKGERKNINTGATTTDKEKKRACKWCSEHC